MDSANLHWCFTCGVVHDLSDHLTTKRLAEAKQRFSKEANKDGGRQ